MLLCRVLNADPCESKTNCTLCVLDASGYRCFCPDNINLIGGTQRCDLSCTFSSNMTLGARVLR